MTSFVTVTIFLLQITGFYCFGSGAPPKACVTMEPGHTGIVPQTSTSPYTITASSTMYTSNQEITVTIAGSQSHGGLLVQARKSDNSSTTPIGTFMTESIYTKLTQCTAAADSWTHSSATLKTTSTVIWKAPSSGMDTVWFRATVAANKTHYWLGHISMPLTYNNTGGTDNTDSSSMKSVVSCVLIITCLLGLQL